MYNNQEEINKAIEDFLAVPENYELVKQTALNIIIKIEAENKSPFNDDLDHIIGIICSLHLLHGLSYRQIENEFEYMASGEIEN